MYISFPISYPISLLLDYLLGTHTKSRFRNNDLVALIELHTHNELKKMHMIEDKEGNLVMAPSSTIRFGLTGEWHKGFIFWWYKEYK